VDASRTVGGAYTSGNWNGCVLNGVLVFNNGVDQLQVLEGGDTTFKDSVSFPTTVKAKVVRSFKNYLFALNLTESSTDYPYAIRWSDAADPGTEPPSWDITDPAVDAGRNTLADSQGELVDALALRDQLIIYKTDAVYAAQFIGGAFVFSFRKLFDKWGMLSTNCAANFEGGQFVVGSNDIYVHDGVRQRSVSDQLVRDYFYTDLNSNYIDSVHVVANYKEDEMWVCYPSSDSITGSCNKALVWNWKNNAWSIRDLPNTSYATVGVIDPQLDDQWDTATGSWNEVALAWDSSRYNPSNTFMLMLSKDNTKFYKLGDEVNYDGVAFSWRLEKSSVDMEDPYEFKWINSVLPKLVGDTVQISVGTQNRIGDGVSWSSPVTFDSTSSVRAYFRKQGRYISFKFEGTSAKDFSLVGFNIEGSVGGEK
jgi:hypothetical protein